MRSTTLALLSAALAVELCLTSASRATTLTLPLTAVAQTESFDQENFFVTPIAGDQVFADWTPASNSIQERHAVFEFSLAGVPAGAVVESAEFRFNVSQTNSRVSGSGTSYPSISFIGYAGDNFATADDATRPRTSELAKEFINLTGDWSLFLDVARVQSIIDQGPSALGMYAYPNTEALTVGIWTAAQGTAVAAPTIELTIAGGATLDGDFNNDGFLDHADLTILTTGYGQHLTGYENGDISRDGVINLDDFTLFDRALANYHPQAAGFLAVVPEPAFAVAIPLVLTACASARRRK